MTTTTNSRNTINTMMNVYSVITSVTTFADKVKADKKALNKYTTEWFSKALSAMPLEDIPGELTKASSALRSAGFFGQEEPVKEGSRQTIAGREQDRVSKFFIRSWKASYGATYGLELSGSSVLTWKELAIKAVKTWQDTINESLTEAGLLPVNVQEVLDIATDLFRQQAEDMQEAIHIAENLKAAQDDAHTEELEKSAAAAMAKVMGISVDEAIKMIEERKAAVN